MTTFSYRESKQEINKVKIGTLLLIFFCLFRDSIFIFISNIGGQEIATKLLELYDKGAKRNDVEFHDFEPIIRRTAYFQGYLHIISSLF